MRVCIYIVYIYTIYIYIYIINVCVCVCVCVRACVDLFICSYVCLHMILPMCSNVFYFYVYNTVICFVMLYFETF